MSFRVPIADGRHGFYEAWAKERWRSRDRAPDRRRLVLWAYFDESGKLANSDFICLAGYICDDGWECFSKDWEKLLKRFEIPLIHAAKLVRRAKPYELLGWDKQKEERVFVEFAKVIRRHLLGGFGIGVDAKFYRSMTLDARKLIGNEDAQDFAFHRLLKLVVKQLQLWKYESSISLTFDFEDQFSVKCMQSLMLLRQQRQEVKNLISSIGFADDEVYYPLQAADLLAYGTYRNLRAVAPDYFAPLVALPTDDDPGPQYWSEYYDPVCLQTLYDDLRAKP